MSDNPMPSGVSSDEDTDWEEVDVADAQPRTLEITLNAQPKAQETKKKSGLSHAERILRIDCHKMHTVALLAHARIRNHWLNDELLQARILSICPMKLQNAFAMIHKSRVPDSNQRGRMFENAIRDLTDWWSGSFEISPEGHLRSRTFHDVQKVVERYRVLLNDDDSDDREVDLEVLQDALGEDCEIIRSPKSLMKHLLMGRGSRDTSAQLFTALCRALAIPARLVVSLQSVPWQASAKYPKTKPVKVKTPGKGKGKGRAPSAGNISQASESDEFAEDHMEEESTSASSSAPDLKGKGKAVNFPGTGQRLDSGLPVDKGKGKEKAKPVIKLRKSRPHGRKLGDASPSTPGVVRQDPTITPPVYWTEVFSKPDGRWLPVDPIRSIVNKRKVFDPTPTTIVNTTSAAVAQFSRFNSPTPTKRVFIGSLNQENRLLYVLAFEEDGYAKDVTRRYAREYGAKVSKMQGGSGAANMGGGGKGRLVWWNHVLSLVQRPYRLHRDDIEDEELETAQLLEGMPTTIGGFKDHPIYVLTRHLKQTETIHPPPPSTPELGKFRGEPVYPRSAVVSLKTAENWMRSEGRTVKTGEQPLKMIKFRAGTVNKLRELEVLKTAGANREGGPSTEAMQGLYSRSQTEPFVPDPVVDGIVPKNNFGNIDLYTPSMLPHGAVHIPSFLELHLLALLLLTPMKGMLINGLTDKGVAKIARKVGFDFAEAVTGFEFKKQRAYPVIEGIVIAKENEQPVLEAYWESEQVAERKAREKREARVIKQWTRLIHGLRIRQRLQEQYGTKPSRTHEDEVEHKEKENGEQSGSRDGDGKFKAEAEKSGQLGLEAEREMLGDDRGGYLVGADDVVEAFHLPKYQYVPDQPVLSFQQTEYLPTTAHPNNLSLASVKKMELEEDSATSDPPDFVTYDLDEEEDLNNLDDNDTEMNNIATPDTLVPRTMAELAEDAATLERQREQDSSPHPNNSSSLPPPRLSSIGQRRRQRRAEQPGDENENEDVGHAPRDEDGGKNEIDNVNDGREEKKIDDDDINIEADVGIDTLNEKAVVPTTPSGVVKRRSMRNLRQPTQPRMSVYVDLTLQRRRSTRSLGRKRNRGDQSDAEDSEVGTSGIIGDDVDVDVDVDVDDDDEYDGGTGTPKHSVKSKKKPRRTITSRAATTTTKVGTSAEERDARNVPTSTRTLRPRTSKK